MKLWHQSKTTLLSLALGLALLACAGGQSAIQADDGVLTPEVGTATGNPSIPAKQSLVFSLDDGPTGETNADPECRPYINESKGVYTQRCFLTPPSFAMGVLAIYLVECVDAQALPVACDSPTVVAVSKRTALYLPDAAKDPVEIVIKNGEVQFPEALTSIISEIHAGGMQVVLSHMTYLIPDTKAVTPALRGLPALVCTTSDEVTELATRLNRCGNEQAERGDILFDPELSGAYDFFANPWSETRPLNYDQLMGYSGIREGTEHSIKSLIDLNPELNPEFTKDFYSVDGYFAPIFSFQKTVDFPVTAGVTYDVVFNLTKTLSYVDGWRASNSTDHSKLCVQEFSPESCAHNADPKSVGVYNPQYDGTFHPKLPHVFVGVTGL